MSYRNALSIIDGRLDTLFDVLDMEIHNGDLSEADVGMALRIYGLTEAWEEWRDYE